MDFSALPKSYFPQIPSVGLPALHDGRVLRENFRKTYRVESEPSVERSASVMMVEFPGQKHRKPTPNGSQCRICLQNTVNVRDRGLVFGRRVGFLKKSPENPTIAHCTVTYRYVRPLHGSAAAPEEPWQSGIISKLSQSGGISIHPAFA